MDRLKNKIILITGAARGQGAAEARLFASEAAQVYLSDLRDDEGQAVAADIRAAGGWAQYLHHDVTLEKDWTAVIAAIDKLHGKLDGLVNNAGISFTNTLEKISLEDWERVHRINLTGPFLGIRYCAPLLRKAGGGAIVNIGSAAGMSGTANTAYSSSKWGLRGLTKSAALLLGRDGIRVNAIHPGAIVTPMISDNPAVMSGMAAITPMGRNGQPEEVADLLLFLMSDNSKFISGADIEIDGGMGSGFVYNPPRSNQS